MTKFNLLAFLCLLLQLALAVRQKRQLIPVRQMLEQAKEFDLQLFSSLLTQKPEGDKPGLTALFLSGINLLMESLEHDFAGMVKVESIGKSY